MSARKALSIALFVALLALAGTSVRAIAAPQAGTSEVQRDSRLDDDPAAAGERLDELPAPEATAGPHAEGGPYRVQVAAFLDTRRASRLKKRLEGDDRLAGQKVAIEYSARSGVYRVKVGGFSEEAGAETLLVQLLEAGYDHASVVKDPFPGSGPSAGAAAAVPGVAAEPAAADEARAFPASPEGVPAKPLAETGGVPGASPRSDYLLGPEDLLEISVFELEGLNKTVRVSEEGVVTLPLLGEVRAEGLTQKELEDRIGELLAEKYINDPQVSVFIREYRSRSVSVIGAVGKPGDYRLLGTRTLLHLISEAGGLTPSSGQEAYIIRVGPGGESQRLRVDLRQLMVEGRPEANLLVLPGDVINVPVDEEVSIFVFGAVLRPGELTFRRSEAVTLLQAISKAGGVTERAAEERIRVKRREEQGGETQLKVNLQQIIKGKKEDVPLQDADVIVVPETVF